MDRAFRRLGVRGEEADGAELGVPRVVAARVQGAQSAVDFLLQLRVLLRYNAVQVERFAEQARQHRGLDVQLDKGGDDS